MSCPLARSLASCTAPKRSSTSTTRRNSCQYALRKASSISRFWASWRSTPSSPFQACSQRLCEPHGQRWHSIAASAPSGPWLFSRSISSGTDRRAICSVSPRVRCSQSRGTCSGGVCQKTRLTLPSFICTVPPWASSTWMRSRCRRRSTPTMRPRLAPLLRRTSARRPGSASAAARAAPPAPAARHPRHLDLGAGLAVAADAREVAAGRVEAAAVGHRHLEARHVGLERLDALHVLVLAERGLDGAPDRRQVVAGREQERHRAVAQLELARDRLGRAVHHPLHVVEPVAHVEGHHALALGIDAAAARAPRHLGQLVVGEAAEAAVGALGQRLQHHALGRHVDAERHRLGGEHHLAEAPLEEQLDEALHGGQDARVVEPHPHAEAPGRWSG